MSKKIFSAQDWENVPSEILQTHTPDIAPIYNKVKGDVESVVREIEQRAIDIAPNYKDWVELGFALVNGLGENGREYAIQRARHYCPFFLPFGKSNWNLIGSVRQGTFIHFAKYPKWQNGQMDKIRRRTSCIS